MTAYNSIYTISKHHLPGKHGLVADPNDDFNCEKPAMETERFYCIVSVGVGATNTDGADI